jgi:uncharacterized protein (UPF0264 family)
MRPGPDWRGLLVSVRDPAEVEPALVGGATVIDVKEPHHGPLGAADPATVVAIARAVAGRVPWTLACGELATGGPTDFVRRVIAGLPAAVPRPAAAKAGPAGLHLASWQRAFAAFIRDLPGGVEPVTVAYADADRAAAPAVEAIISAAATAGGRLLLIDTFDKAGAGVLPANPKRLAGWVDQARGSGLLVAVAGRLALEDVRAVTRLGVDIVGMRGSVCRGGRTGRVDAALVAAAARGAPPSRTLSREETHHPAGSPP